MKPDRSPQATIRLARAGDAKPIALLCHQLGYPATQEEVQRRLAQIQQDEGQVVYVAELAERQVVGWVHLYVCQLLEADPQAEIGGLVVDEGYRRGGLGRLLMQSAERWAGEKGCWAVHLRTNVIRKEAHLFYERVGYSKVKTQLAFRKVL